MRHVRPVASALVLAALFVTIVAGVHPARAWSGPGAQTPRDAGARRAGTAIIAGRIFVEGSDPPAPVANVRVTAASGANAAEPVFTDAAGRFEIPAVEPGHYTVTAEKTGFARLRYGAASVLEPALPIDVREGAAVRGVDMAIARGAAITGRIVDELGDPVAGAFINVGVPQIAGRESRFVNASPSSTSTDDRGEYRIGDLAPGRYVLYVNGATEGSGGAGPPEWNRTFGWVKTFYQDADTLAGATIVALRAGEERTGVDFRLVPSRSAKVTFRLTDASGAPLTGVLNIMQRTDAGLTANRAVPLSPSNQAMTPSLEPGEWIGMLIGAGTSRALFHLNVSSGEESTLTVIAGAGARMSGRVVFNGSRPAPPFGGIGLRARGVGVDEFAPYSSNATPVRADGTFEVTGLVGTVVLQPSQPIPGWTLAAMRYGNRDLLDEPLALAGTENITDIDLVFTDELAQLSGTVVDAEGRPSPGCAVVLAPAQSDPRANSDRARLLRADQNGRFAIDDVRSGAYVAAAIKNIDAAAWLSRDYRDRLLPNASALTLADHEKKTATLVCAPLP